MSFESVNGPGDQNPEELITPEERQETIVDPESMDAIKKHLESIADELDALRNTLRSREREELNELCSPATIGRALKSSEKFRSLVLSDVSSGDTEIALTSLKDFLKGFDDASPGRVLREDKSSLMRVQLALRSIQESLNALASQLAEHSDEKFKSLKPLAIKISRQVEDLDYSIDKKKAFLKRF